MAEEVEVIRVVVVISDQVEVEVLVMSIPQQRPHNIHPDVY